MSLSVAAAVLGWWLARRAYEKADKGYKEPIREISPRFYKTLFRKYYIDEFYDWFVTGRDKIAGVRLGAIGLGDALWKFDAKVIDGAVNGVGWSTKEGGTVSSWWDKWIIDGLCVNGVAIVTRMLSYPVRVVQWGLVQWYALVMVGGLVGFVVYYVVNGEVAAMLVAASQVSKLKSGSSSEAESGLMYNHILSIVLFTPLLGAILLLFVPKENKNAIRWMANIFAMLGLRFPCPSSRGFGR